MFNCSLIILIIIIASMISADKSSNLGKCQQEDLLLADCLEPHQNYIETSLFDASGREISNPIFMKKFTNFTKTVATCIGTDLICDTARHYKFFVDSLSYVGENLYDLKVFKCLERITPKLQDCLNTVPISFRNLRKFQSYTLDQKKLVNCVIEKMKDDQVCKNRKIIDSVEKSLNATRLIIRNFKRFRKGIIEPMVFSESMLSGIEVKRNKKI
ncbi:hypothetical protein L3Y34_003142 [Caenorhabditis briggsae]|uniref:DUF19 domain-containing protein n=1 Tax=Caenorhabditis briggsae TaxID=6238 RepID=A0AAE9A5G9_CAEBR|nr:hypothetical protein L3Y34_003142 [Caenorhabditis briggsae]